MAKNRTGVQTRTAAIVHRTGVNNSVAFARWQQRATIKLVHATHSINFSQKRSFSYGPNDRSIFDEDYRQQNNDVSYSLFKLAIVEMYIVA